MIAHTSLAVSRYPKAKAFYLGALAPLGYTNNMEYGESAGFNDGKNTDFWITREKVVVPMHVAFQAEQPTPGGGLPQGGPGGGRKGQWRSGLP